MDKMKSKNQGQEDRKTGINTKITHKQQLGKKVNKGTQTDVGMDKGTLEYTHITQVNSNSTM